MQFFYIDYMNGEQKERNIGFLKVEHDGISVGLRGVPAQCGGACGVYAVNGSGGRSLLGEVPVKNGYGMEKLRWTQETGFRDCVEIEIPLYGTRIGKCVLRERGTKPAASMQTRTDAFVRESAKEPDSNSNDFHSNAPDSNISGSNTFDSNAAELSDGIRRNSGGAGNMGIRANQQEEIVGKVSANKWSQLLEIYPRVHILPEAQSVLIKPKDLIVLTEKHHGLAANSFVLHAYYNYRQLLLFCYHNGTGNTGNHADLHAADSRIAADSGNADAGKPSAKPEYYLGAPGIYNERECRVAEMFGFEGFESGEARMHEERERVVYNGCFGYYMKRVEI